MTKPRRTRRRFATAWDEIEYLYDKAAYWLDYRKQRRKAAAYVRRLRPLIDAADPRQEAILGAACRALLADFDGDLAGEIRFTKKKVGLLEQLLNGREERLGYDRTDVAVEYEVLAALYEENGQLAEARRVKQTALRGPKPRRLPGTPHLRPRSKAS